MNPPQSNPRSAAEREMAGRLEEFRSLRARGALCTELTDLLATEAASAFLNHFREDGRYLEDAIALLAEIATLEEPCLAETGRRATFPLLVESLSDSFEPRYCELYDRAFAQMVSVCRRLPAGKELDATLRRFGLDREEDLLARKARLRQPRPLLDPADSERVRKVLVLSRVTLGADVAITSVVLEKAKATFPQAERVLVGSSKLRQLFGGDPSLRIREVPYAAGGGLLERLGSWPRLLEAFEEETGHLGAPEYLVIDPDSRLLQLGLLPALRDDARYFFFESRGFGELGQGSLSEIALRWLNGMFGGQDEILPAVRLRKEDQEVGSEVCRELRRRGGTCLVSVSFGVGGNNEKRLPEPFERSLLRRLLDQGATVLLDKGLGPEEVARADHLMEPVRAGGGSVIELDRETLRQPFRGRPLRCHLLTWQGDIGTFCGLVAESDLYIGYDSAGQHIAAALGVPTVDVFSRSASAVFRERWRPTGSGIVRVVAENPSGGNPNSVEAILSEVLGHYQQIRSLKSVHDEEKR